MFRLATFNAGLAVGVLPRVTARLPGAIKASAQLDVDLLFVQEFWLDAHWEQLQARVRGELPFSLRPVSLAAGPGRCTVQQLQALQQCAESHCAGLRDEALARCVVDHCAGLALALPLGCLNCIANRPVGTLQEIFERCIGEAEPAPQVGTEHASRGTGLIAYGGSFGTGLLTRLSPLETATVEFASTLNARGAVWARMNVPDLGVLHVFGAHLSPGGEEQAPQVERLLAWIDDRAGLEPAILLGDLNITPASPLYRQLLDAGFRDADEPEMKGTLVGRAC